MPDHGDPPPERQTANIVLTVPRAVSPPERDPTLQNFEHQAGDLGFNLSKS
jgi:hypothetical protein